MSPRGRRGGGERSEDDRQRARLEREQRRAQREGRPIPRTVDDLPVAEPTLDPAASAPQDPAGTGTPAVSPRAAAPDAPPAHGTTPGSEATHGGLWSAGSGGHAAEGPTEARPPADTSPPHDRRPPSGTRPPADGPASARPQTAPPAAPDAEATPWWSRAAAAPPETEAPSAPRPPAPRQPPPPHEPAPAAPRQPRAAEHAPAAAPRSPAAPVPTAPGAPRDVDDWFGPDATGESDARTDDRAGASGPRTDDRTGEHDGPALVPLRPAGPIRLPSQAAAEEGESRRARRRRRKAEKRNPGPATVHTRTAPARRGVSRIAAFVVLLPIVLVIAVAVFLFQPFSGDGDGEVRVKIPPGSSVDDIGTLLKDRGVVSNALAFSVRARLSGDGDNLKAGTLRLKRHMSYSAALTALQQDPLPPSTIRVSIPEGLSRSEVASSIKKAGVTGSYLTASRRSSGFSPASYGQPKSRSGLEGFLFPATYELQRGGATAAALVKEQLAAFKTNFAKVSMTRARRAKLSRYDVLIVASMIEREVRIPSERKLVAAVIWNRLKNDTPLGIDATTRYAVKNWTRPLKQSEIDSKSPYDTRYRRGLPPTPIGSPGLASIRAAAAPADVSYLYYVVRPCGGGRHAFASTNDKFLKDQAAYATAQRKAGGDPSPVDAKGCKG